ncbi:protein CREG1-like [Copidosoma floridanum]|uniref:protein CREG1-like n=1 Tax=Copidosoma floridanum TaxID=29053 RepID=UPI0006C9A465|nr:protein CREG1-like [Copidosoma floridanum]
MELLGIFVLVLAAVATNAGVAKKIRQPPSPDKVALMARFIVNESNYTAIGTTSVRQNTLNYPYVSLLSLSDGLPGNGSGVPYVFITPLDQPGHDVKKSENVTMMMSLAQGDWCTYKNYDPMDPRCARVTLAGKMKKIDKENPEFASAKAGVFGRHPLLSHVPASHGFYFAKMEIESIFVLSDFGGSANVTPQDYYNADKQELSRYTRFYKR